MTNNTSHNNSASLCYISVSGHLCSLLHGDLMFSLLNRLGLGLAKERTIFISMQLIGRWCSCHVRSLVEVLVLIAEDFEV